ncbi:MAG: globin [Bacteroidales bacterium]|nr:globin [Bacteroidales bacterium]
MELKINSYAFGERPQAVLPVPEFLQAIGEEGARKLVSKHYDLLVQSDIKHLFPTDPEELEHAKLRSSDFVIQICGGPQHFNQNRGRPMLSNRHQPFAITPEGRITWLECYRQAILELDIADELIISFWNYVNVFSNWMVNTPSKQTGFVTGFQLPKR